MGCLALNVSAIEVYKTHPSIGPRSCVIDSSSEVEEGTMELLYIASRDRCIKCLLLS